MLRSRAPRRAGGRRPTPLAAVTLAATLAAAALGAASPARAADDAMEAVRRSLTAPERTTYIGEVETLRFAGARSEGAILRVEHRAPDFTRRLYLAPPELAGDSVILHDGRTFAFDGHRRLFIHGTARRAEDVVSADRFELIARNYRAAFGGDSFIAGRAVRQIALLRRDTGRRAVALWVDAQTGLPLERETYRADGSIVFRLRFTSIRYLRDLPASLFALSAPPEFRSVEGDGLRARALLPPRRADARPEPAAPYPVELPEGFRFVHADATTIGGAPATHRLYSDGVRTLSLFDSPPARRPVFAGRAVDVRVGAAAARYLEDGNDGLLTWSTPRRCTTLVGALTKAELLRIARALPP